LAGLLGIAIALLYLYAFANLSFASRAEIGERLDASISRGLDFLDAEDGFRRAERDGGRHPVEKWIARRMLPHLDHAGFAGDLETGWSTFLSQDTYRFFWKLSESSSHRLTPREKRWMRRVFEDPEAVSSAGGPWYAWFYYALHPGVGTLSGDAGESFRGNRLGAWTGYDLTHRVMAYRLFLSRHPDHPAAGNIRARYESALTALHLEMRADFRLLDLYFERLAFLLEDPGGGAIRERWIERTLDAQNPDGGWAFASSLPCALRDPIGFACPNRPSHPHSTFLAVYALVQYRERLRGAG
jgi:hypothetical protein